LYDFGSTLALVALFVSLDKVLYDNYLCLVVIRKHHVLH